MNTFEDNSILSEPETTFEVGTDEIKSRMEELIAEDTPESHDEIVQLAADHGIPVTPEMDNDEIKNRVNAVL